MQLLDENAKQSQCGLVVTRLTECPASSLNLTAWVLPWATDNLLLSKHLCAHTHRTALDLISSAPVGSLSGSVDSVVPVVICNTCDNRDKRANRANRGQWHHTCCQDADLTLDLATGSMVFNLPPVHIIPMCALPPCCFLLLRPAALLSCCRYAAALFSCCPSRRLLHAWHQWRGAQARVYRSRAADQPCHHHAG